MGVIAHPGDVHGMALSFDGRKLVTLGTHGILSVWDVNTAALDTMDHQRQSMMAAEDSRASSIAAAEAKWSHLIGDPVLLEELKDYFCYAQVMSRQQDSEAYNISGKMPVSILPDLMRAAGYYPSQADIASLLAHVKFLADTAPADDDAGLVGSDGAPALSSSGSGSKSGLKQQAADVDTAGQAAGAAGVDFETFLCLCVNHRPVAGVDQQQIDQAFQKLGADTAAGRPFGAKESEANAGVTRGERNLCSASGGTLVCRGCN
eukprot:GHUV01039243.1.p1 GENE.GHUV01039243.1~~GHUV01039243.1.p1  ORF type:complete len:262 (+),score=103.59 GHUV01039243.1:338-1123(+)